MIKIDAYTDFPVNNLEVYDASANEWIPNPKFLPGMHKWRTQNVTTMLPNDKGGIGRVDHFMKTSIKQIVNACVKNVIEREEKSGKHMIRIELVDDKINKTIEIAVYA